MAAEGIFILIFIKKPRTRGDDPGGGFKEILS